MQDPQQAPLPESVARTSAESVNGSDGNLIEVRLPASPTHLPVLRTLAADLAARLDFNLDEVDDLRMAADEAGATLVADAQAPTRLQAVFRVLEDGVSVTVRARTRSGRAPAENTFGWRVLTALVDEVRSGVDEAGEVYLELVKRRGAGGA